MIAKRPMPDLDRPPKMVTPAPSQWCRACDCRVAIFRPFLDLTEAFRCREQRCRCNEPDHVVLVGLYPTETEVPGSKYAGW